MSERGIKLENEHPSNNTLVGVKTEILCHYYFDLNNFFSNLKFFFHFSPCQNYIFFSSYKIYLFYFYSKNILNNILNSKKII